MRLFADTPALCGPLRRPRQLLARQVDDGHKSIHDDAMAAELVLNSATLMASYAA